MQRGWKSVNGKYKYYAYLDRYHEQNYSQLLNSKFNDGSMLTNVWAQIVNEAEKRYYWYHFDSNGYMQTGWLQLGSTWYYLKPAGFSAWAGPEGSMLYNTTVTINGKSYNFDSNGACTNP